LAEVDL